MKTGRLIVLDRSGHTTVEYNRADPADVARADKVLADALAQGRLAYREDTQQVVRTIDPEAEEIVVLPRLVGG